MEADTETTQALKHTNSCNCSNCQDDVPEARPLPVPCHCSQSMAYQRMRLSVRGTKSARVDNVQHVS